MATLAGFEPGVVRLKGGCPVRLDDRVEKKWRNAEDMLLMPHGAARSRWQRMPARQLIWSREASLHGGEGVILARWSG